MPATSQPGRSVTSKVLSLLEVFETRRGPLALSELAAATGLPLSTTHRLAGELCEWGALERDGSGRYHVGLRLWEISQNAGRQLRETARPFLQDLFSLTQETSHIAIREGHEALYIDRLYSTKRVPRASRVGGRLPLHATAVGKVLLAYEDSWVQEAYVRRQLETPTRGTHVHPARLREELQMIQEQGYATTNEEMRVGSCSIAVPVHFPGGRCEASIGLVMFSTRAASMTRQLPALRGTAERIEESIAHFPAGYLRSTSERTRRV